MKITLIVSSLCLILFSCDNELMESRKNNTKSDSNFSEQPNQRNQGQRSSSGDQVAESVEGGMVMSLPESVESKEISEENKKHDKKSHKFDKNSMMQNLPKLFGFALPMIQSLFKQSPGVMGSSLDCRKPGGVLRGQPGMNQGFPRPYSVLKQRIQYECISEELEADYFGYMTAYLKPSVDEEKPSHLGCWQRMSTQMIKCKSFKIVLPKLEDGEHELHAYFVSADKKTRYKGAVDPKLTVENGKITEDAKLTMKKIVAESSGSVSTEFTD